MQTSAFLMNDETQIETLDKGIRRQILGFNNQIMMVKIFFDTGSIGYVHNHFHSQVTYVESGEFLVTIGDERRTLGSGDAYFMEPNIDHGTECVKEGVLIDVFSPIREDFLSKAI